MSDNLSARLSALSTEIAVWRSEAQRLDAAARLPNAKFDDELLLSVEETSGRIYEGIADFDALVVDIDKKSHAAAGQIAEVGDTMRLVLMEITELGTRLYSLRADGPAATSR